MPEVQPTNNPVPSDHPADARDNFKRIDEIVNLQALQTNPTRTGKRLNTLFGIASNYIASPINGGVWASGVTFTAYNQYMAFNGVTYKPSFTTPLPYETQGSDPTTTPDSNFVEPFSEINSTNISNYTDIVYNNSSGSSAVENMLAEFNLNPTFRAIGTITKTGGTTWEYADSTGPITIDNFRAFNAVNALDFGADPTGSLDSYEAINLAARAAFDGKVTLYIPGGNYISSATFDWSLYLFFRVVGDGHYTTNIDFTNDADGIIFGGQCLEGLAVTGSSFTSGDGIRYVSTQRKYVSRVRAEGFRNNHVFVSGNLSYFNFIFGISGTQHGFVMANTDPDSNAVTVGMMDLRGNTLDGLHIEDGVQPNVSQQMVGGLVTCQSNGRYGAYISGRGHSLSIYEEANTFGVQFGTTANGCYCSLHFGDVNEDLGTNNNYREFRDGSVETVLDNHIRVNTLEFINSDFVGQMLTNQTEDNAFDTLTTGSGSFQTVRFGRADSDIGRYAFDIIGQIYSRGDIHFTESNNQRIIPGSGNPEGAVSARAGSIFLNENGISGGQSAVYFKESGSGNTGWVGK